MASDEDAGGGGVEIGHFGLYGFEVSGMEGSSMQVIRWKKKVSVVGCTWGLFRVGAN